MVIILFCFTEEYSRLGQVPERFPKMNLWGLLKLIFLDQMPFLLPNQQCQSMEGDDVL